MDFCKYKSQLDALEVRRSNLRSEMRSLLVTVLSQLPGKGILLDNGTAAYSYVEGSDGWLEECFTGIRLDGNGSVELTAGMDGKCERGSFENGNDVVSEHDHHIDMNWYSLLGAAMTQIGTDRKSGLL